MTQSSEDIAICTQLPDAGRQSVEKQWHGFDAPTAFVSRMVHNAIRAYSSLPIVVTGKALLVLITADRPMQGYTSPLCTIDDAEDPVGMTLLRFHSRETSAAQSSFIKNDQVMQSLHQWWLAYQIFVTRVTGTVPQREVVHTKLGDTLLQLVTQSRLLAFITYAFPEPNAKFPWTKYERPMVPCHSSARKSISTFHRCQNAFENLFTIALNLDMQSPELMKRYLLIDKLLRTFLKEHPKAFLTSQHCKYISLGNNFKDLRLIHDYCCARGRWLDFRNWTIILFQFMLMLRRCEVLHIELSDLFFSRGRNEQGICDEAYVMLRREKGVHPDDKVRGTLLRLVRNDNAHFLCPIRALFHCVRTTKIWTGYLFRTGSPKQIPLEQRLLKGMWSTTFRGICDAVFGEGHGYSTHSMRRTMARYAYACCKDDNIVRMSGRWSHKSKSFFEYVGDWGGVDFAPALLVPLQSLFNFQAIHMSRDVRNT